MDMERVPVWSFNCIAICTLIGLAFDEKNTKKICKKFGLDQGKSLDGPCCYYLLHQACHEKEGVVAKYLTSLFNKKYSKEMLKINKMKCQTEQAVAKEFLEWKDQTSVGLIWALLSDPRSFFHQHGAYLVHRFSYQQFQKVQAENKKTSEEMKVISRLKNELKNARIAEKNQRQRLGWLQLREQKTAQAEEKLRIIQTQHKKRITQLELQLAEDKKLRRQLRIVEYELEEERKKKTVLKAKSFEGAKELKCSNSSSIVSSCTVCTSCNEEQICPLEAMRIAVVGGMDRLESRYREVVEDLGGDFVFHNGDCHGGVKRLKNVVCRSDIIVFVTKKNSHAALRAVKGLCKKTGKQFLVLKETGPQALKKALRKTA